MQITAERDSLAAALAIANRATASLKPSSMFPAALRLSATADQLAVASTDGDLSIMTVTAIPVSAEGGTVLAPAKLLAAIVGALPPGSVSLTSTSDALEVKAGRSHFTLRTFPTDNLPPPSRVDAPQVEVDAALLRTSLTQVVFAASPDALRPVLTGVLVEARSDGLRLVATDSYRLVYRDVPGLRVLGDRPSALVPSRVLTELQRLLTGVDTVDVYLGEQQVAFQVGATYLSGRLIEGEFPNYRPLLPTEPPSNRLTVECEPLLAAIKRVALVAAGDKTTPVRVQFTTEGVRVSVQTSDGATASEQVDGKYEGDDLTLGFNPAFLTEGIAALGTDTVVLGLTNEVKPAIITGAEDEGGPVQILMPVRLS